MADNVPTLNGKLVLLRALGESDKATYIRYAGQAEAIWGFGGSASDVRRRTPEDAERWLQGRPNSVRWGIEVEGRLIGTVGLHTIDEANKRATLAIGIMDSTDMNRGFGTESIRLVVEHGFHTMYLHRIDLRVLARNKRAIRAYEKCGFIREGIERHSALIDGRWEDDLIMGVINDPDVLSECSEHGVRLAEERWLNATVSGDVASLDHMMADEYEQVTGNGKIARKADVLLSYEGEGRHWDKASSSNLHVRLSGETAIVTGFYQAAGQNGDERFNYSARYVAVWVWRDGRWQIVSDQSTEIE